jgi:membrane protein
MGRADDMRARVERYAERADAFRRKHGSVDAVYVMADRDVEIGGGIMAGALAYRVFVWLLPFALVVVGGVGIAADVSDESPASAARSLGLQGIVSNSVAQASQGSSRWYALLIGIPILIWASRGLLKALIVVHRLIWGDERRQVPKPNVGATLRILVLMGVYFAIREGARAVESWSGSFLLSTLFGVVLVFLWWLGVSLRLPHHGAPWQALLPGAALMAVGMELISSIGTQLIAPRIATSQSAYGALGVAATLLLGLFLVSRLVVAAAVVNATAWERRSETESSPGPVS